MSELRRELDHRVEQGLIRRADSGDLSIYCYTEACTYSRAWDEYTMMARGLVMDRDDMIVARPFKKFFNLGEPNCPPVPNLPYTVYEKLDGSLGIWFFCDGRWRVVTKGSFDNDYTRWAMPYADRLAYVPKSWTVMTEIVLPPEEDGMARVVKHAPGVYLLGAVETDTAAPIPFWAAQKRWWSTQFANVYPQARIEDLLRRAEQETDTEGWVIRFSDDTRMKIKTAWFLRLFRAVSNLNEKSVRELLLSGGDLSGFPEEYREEAEALRDSILDRVAEREARIQEQFAHLRHLDRKSFALSIADHPDKSFLFTLLDGKPIRERLLKIV